MFKFRENSVLRFNLLVIFLFTTFGIIIIGKAAIIMFIERDDWNKIKEKNIKHNVPIEAHRGNILADDGGLLVSTLPRYRMKFDFEYINKDRPEDEKKINARRDSIWRKDLKALCIGLNDILPGTSVNQLEERFKTGLTPSKKNGRKKMGYEPYRGSISYPQFRKIKELPIIREGRTLSGCYTQEITERKNILGNTGNSTFGIVRSVEIDGKKVDEANGLEKKYNDFLKGEPGHGTKAKMRGKYILREDKLPTNGYDIQTTLNTRMMDICHTALERELKSKTLAGGWAILMETKTGDIKAIVNLSRNGKGEYTDTIGSRIIVFGNNEKYSQKNHAMSERYEPGSIFKTVAITAMLADGKLTTKDSVFAYKDMKYNFDGHKISDEMYRDNGTGKYSMTDAMMYSSNISLVQYIRRAYKSCPEEYSKTLVRFGLEDNYNLIENEVTPKIKKPGTKEWDGYSLHSMSMGYAVEMTAINIVSFYNTIANGGRQMKPRLVKAVMNNEEIIEEYPTEVLNEQLFSKEVARSVTAMLDSVVNGLSIDKVNAWRKGKRDGTGSGAHSDLMRIAGKTGTAKQYASKAHPDGTKDKLLSFCGFFPADAPEYTLIVQIMYDYELDPRPKDIKERSSYGGGSTSAHVFKEIAEKIMADKLFCPIEYAVDKKNPSRPTIKRGSISEAEYLLSCIGTPDSLLHGMKSYKWGDVRHTKDGIKVTAKEIDTEKVPNVEGMGAKEAIYLMQKCGLNTRIKGYGTVKRQSVIAGTRAIKGDTVRLTLEP